MATTGIPQSSSPAVFKKSREWTEWFTSRKSADMVNKSAQEQLFQAFNATLTADEMKQAVIAHQETAFLYKTYFGTGRVAVFHNFTEIGGTVYGNNKSRGFIQDLNNELAVILTPDETILFEKPTGTAIQVPTITTLLGLTEADDIGTVAIGARSTYKPRNLIPITPFMLKTIGS